MDAVEPGGHRSPDGVYVEVAVAPITAVQWTNPLSNSDGLVEQPALQDADSNTTTWVIGADDEDDEVLHYPDPRAPGHAIEPHSVEQSAFEGASSNSTQWVVNVDDPALHNPHAPTPPAAVPRNGPPVFEDAGSNSVPRVIEVNGTAGTRTEVPQTAEAENYHQEHPLQAMLAMGFTEDVANDALRSSGGDVDAAIEAALGPIAGTPTPNSGGDAASDVSVYLELLMGGDESTQAVIAQEVGSADCKAELIAAVIATLSRSSLDGAAVAGQARAAAVLHRLADVNEELKTEVVKAGAGVLLIEMVGSGDIHKIHAALGTLCCIADGSSFNTHALLTAGAARQLVALLVQGDSTNKIYAIAVLANLLSGRFSGRFSGTPRNGRDPAFSQHSVHCDIVVAAGAIAPLVSLAQHGSEAEMVGACALVHDLIRTDNGGLRKGAFVAAGAVGPLVDLLTHANMHSSNANANAASALALLAAGPKIDDECNSRKDAMISSGVIAPLVMLLSHSDERAKNNAACALTELSSGDDHRKDVIMTMGVVQAFVRLLGDAYTQASAARALSMLAAGRDDFTPMCQQRKDSIVAAGAVIPLVALLRNGLGPGQQAAAATLSGLVNDANEHRKNVVVAAGGVAQLVNLVLCGTTPEVKGTAAAALAGLAIRVKGNDVVAGTRKDAIISAGAVVPLVALLTDMHDGAHQKTNAGWALARLIGGKDSNRDGRLHAVAQALPGCDDHTDIHKVKCLLEELAGTLLEGDTRSSDHNSTSGCCVVA